MGCSKSNKVFASDEGYYFSILTSRKEFNYIKISFERCQAESIPDSELI